MLEHYADWFQSAIGKGKHVFQNKPARSFTNFLIKILRQLHQGSNGMHSRPNAGHTCQRWVGSPERSD